MHLSRSGGIEGYEAAVLRAGGNPQSLLEQVGLSGAQLRQPDTLISYEKMADLLDLTAAACNSPFFSLELAAGQGGLVIGELAITSGQQKSFEDSLHHINRYFHLHATGVRLIVEGAGDLVEIQFKMSFSNDYGLAQLHQLSQAIVIAE